MNTLTIKPFKKTTQTCISLSLLLLAFTISACSSDSEPSSSVTKDSRELPEDHFLKEKLETIKKAEEVNQIIQDAAAKQRKTMEEQGG